MADESQTTQERTESPTPRRREQARSEGRVARSQEVSAAMVLLSGFLVLSLAGGRALADYAAALLRESAHALSTAAYAPLAAVALLRAAIGGFLAALLPFAAGVLVLVTAVNLAQARGVFSWKPLEPKLSHLSPVAGLKRLVSVESPFTLLKSVAKLVVLGLVTYSILARAWPELVSLPQTGPSAVAIVMRSLALRLAGTVALSFLGLAVVDYGFQWFRMEKSLRMTRQELVREHRETEGDPLVKGRIQAMARALSRRRMLQRVATADVVVVNPTRLAVALRYDTAEAPAPLVVAMGQRKLAERIRELARKAGVPIVENRPVARALFATAKLGKPIPPALYAAVAEILAFVYRQRGRLPAALARRSGRAGARRPGAAGRGA